MATPPNLVTVVAKQKADEALKQAQEEKVARASGLPEGHVRVRLIRDMFREDGSFLPAGLAVLPEKEVPKSAKRLDD